MPGERRSPCAYSIAARRCSTSISVTLVAWATDEVYRAGPTHREPGRPLVCNPLGHMSVEWKRTGSAKGILDKTTLDIKCPICGAPLQKVVTLGEARKSPTVKCAKGHDVELDASKLDKGVQDIEKRIDNLFG